MRVLIGAEQPCSVREDTTLAACQRHEDSVRQCSGWGRVGKEEQGWAESVWESAWEVEQEVEERVRDWGEVEGKASEGPW